MRLRDPPAFFHTRCDMNPSRTLTTSVPASCLAGLLPQRQGVLLVVPSWPQFVDSVQPFHAPHPPTLLTCRCWAGTVLLMVKLTKRMPWWSLPAAAVMHSTPPQNHRKCCHARSKTAATTSRSATGGTAASHLSACTCWMFCAAVTVTQGRVDFDTSC